MPGIKPMCLSSLQSHPCSEVMGDEAGSTSPIQEDNSAVKLIDGTMNHEEQHRRITGHGMNPSKVDDMGTGRGMQLDMVGLPTHITILLMETFESLGRTLCSGMLPGGALCTSRRGDQLVNLVFD